VVGHELQSVDQAENDHGEGGGWKLLSDKVYSNKTLLSSRLVSHHIDILVIKCINCNYVCHFPLSFILSNFNAP
jgi:hypothetical protein